MDSDTHMKILGNWPDVDLQIVGDFTQSDSATTRAPVFYLRLHMDVELGDSDKAMALWGMLQEGKRKEVYAKVIEIRNADGTKRGPRALRAALNLDDQGDELP